ncbi:MAG: type II toxin-antitoxin system VapB family antitoxin [Acidobacteria bacterium]|nr:type II toxin-antitoxin system VapB family antitoxin [Acidobacteriota bacterium]
MSGPIQIRRPDVAAAARELAALRGVSITDAISQALQAQLVSQKAAQQSEKAARLARADEALKRFRQLPRIGPLLTDDDFYDEDGLPK